MLISKLVMRKDTRKLDLGREKVTKVEMSGSKVTDFSLDFAKIPEVYSRGTSQYIYSTASQ